MARGNTSRTAEHARGDRAGRRAAAGARGRAHAAHRHRADASPAGAVERPEREHSGLAQRRLARSRAPPSRCSTPGRSSCSATAARSAARSSVSTTRPARSSKRARLPLSELGIAPLDVVYGVEAANTTAQPGMTLSEIEQQVLYHAKRKPGGFDPLATLRLQHARPADLAAGEITLFDVLEQARAVRRLLSVARGADPEDLNPPERTGAGRHRSHRARGARRAGGERAQRGAQGPAA